MILQFNYCGEVVNVELTKKKIKNIYMKLDKNNNIVVSAPKHTSDKFIKKFISENLEKFTKAQKTKAKKTFLNLIDQTFYLFGQIERFEIIERILPKTNLKQEYLVFNNKKYKINPRTIQDIILMIYKKELLVYLTASQQKLENEMNIEKHQISIRIKKNAWATNYTTKQKIIYTNQLAAYSHEIIDYVIIHELSHAMYANHSKEFWDNVAKFEPNFKSKKKKLKSFIYF